jgi:hypothetical protein
MQFESFWKIIHDAQGAPDADQQVEHIGNTLENLPAEAVIDFERCLRSLFSRAYTNSLWGAAYLINGGCSDDGFDYFQGWLVLQGENVFEAALRDPDSLADYNGTEENVEGEDLLYVAARAYEKLTGTEIDAAIPDEVPPRDLGDDDWDFDDDAQMKARYPKLFAIFSGDSPLTPPAKRPGSRPWLISTITCGILLVCLIIIGLSASFSRLGKTMDLIDQPGSRPEDLGQMVEDSNRTTRLSLYAGTPIALLYLGSLYLYRRSKKS